MYKYEIVIYWSSEDNCFIASVPELVGCMADGETQEEVLQNVNTVISEWLETARLLGRDIPEPKENSVYA
ncbi:MAG: type II toxin-antitoxin system HicB family antitoxin [Ruminococcus flavefaciens]|nr:type II toxin-antitoxin system HicB family antitoxin [Ruminococcus flavefaciens]